jgi:cell wall-associated NlpC family hydrolase
MNLNKTVKIQISAAIIMALLGGTLCKFSQSYISNYDRPNTENKEFQASVLPMGSTKAFKSTVIEEDNKPEAPALYTPSLTSFNLAFLYGEGDATEESLGAEAAQELSKKDASWLASIYQIADESPEKVAKKLNIPHDPLKGLTFQKVDISFYNETGQKIPPKSNIQEIMSLANTYFYYAAPNDYNAFLDYSNQLWEHSHDVQYSISDIYYCDGTLEGNLTSTLPSVPATPSEALPSQSTLEDETEEVKVIGPGIARKESESASIETESPEEIEVPQQSACQGHVDLQVKAVISGLSDSKKGLFSLDTVGHEINDSIKWPGWSTETKEYATSLADQDWAEAYGLTLNPAFITNPLSYEEIKDYMNRLPETLSQNRTKLIYYALSSVGRVPYYWGGKPACSGYENNDFGALASPDEKGRTLKGLDCSGWISWIYWSAIQRRLSSESTGGLASLGTPIKREELQPGDIILKTGDEGHVVMFLCWESDGDMTVIHESSALVDNVTVTKMSANWPYVRKLID